MLKYSVLIIALFLGDVYLHCQSRSASSLYLEIGGNGGIYSINYDRLLNDDFGLRGGIMLFAAADGSGSAAVIGAPVIGNYFVGEGDHRMELGAGVTFISGAVGGGDVFGEFNAASPTAVIGYRYQPADGGFLFKAAFTPIFFSGRTLPWGGIGLGYSF